MTDFYLGPPRGSIIDRRMAMESAVAAPPPKHPLYFVNRYVDWGVIGGVSVLFFLWLLSVSGVGASKALGIDGTRQEWAWSSAAFLVWIVNWPHFSATNYRLYHSKGNIAQYPFTAYVIPVLLLGATWASFALPQAVAPYFVLLFFIWSPYHFSGQSVGISMIYARRAGFKVGPLERLALSGFIFGTYIYTTAKSQVGTANTNYFSVELPRLGIPRWFPEYVEYGMYACGALFLILVVRWCITQRRMIPPIVLLPAAAQFVWFVPGSTIPNFYEFVPMFHSLQYMLIAWSMQLKERVDAEEAPAPRWFFLGESARWYVINVAGGIVLFWILPRLAARAGWPMGFAEPVILSAVQIHHFFVDGVI
jgi:hypothetical protein